MKTKLALTSLLGALVCSTAVAATDVKPVKIGFVTTLSTPAGYLGEDIRDGFKLAIKQGDGKLGGIPVELAVQDDGNKPAKAKQAIDRLLRDDIQLFTGTVFSSNLAAEVPAVTRKGAFIVSPNAGNSIFAGKQCNPNLFVASYENGAFFEAGGVAANKLGFKRAVVMAPDYQGGRDAINGFKSTFDGEILAELYNPLSQSDFSVQIARIRSLAPDVVYEFEPGGLGINFIKQYASAGLNKTIPLLVPSPSLDTRMNAAIGDAAVGSYFTAIWGDSPAIQQFRDDFQQAYNREPTEYAMEGYDTAKWIASALKAVNGDMSKADDFRAAMRATNFDSLRGNFSLNSNHYPIQDIYMHKVIKTDDGKVTTELVQKIIENNKDDLASACDMTP